MLLVPTGAFAKDKHHNKHHHHHDWSDRGYRGNDRDNRDYWERQRDIEADRVANGYRPDGTPRYQYGRYYYRR